MKIFMCSVFAEDGNGQPFTVNMLTTAVDKETARKGAIGHVIDQLKIDESWNKLHAHATELTETEIGTAMKMVAEATGNLQ